MTVYRCLATLCSALGDAVRQHRLTHDPARPAALPRPPTTERRIWTVEEAARFLRYCHRTDPLIADLCELLIGTGMRKGEALALHWHDVYLNEGALYGRYILWAINNARLVITSPQTRSSKNWVAITPRVAAALTRREAEAPDSALSDRSSDPFTGLVFCRPDGRPLRPQTVLDRFRRHAKEAGVPPHHPARPATPRCHPVHHRGHPARRRLQNPATLHPLHHRQPLQPPHPGTWSDISLALIDIDVLTQIGRHSSRPARVTERSGPFSRLLTANESGLTLGP
ncbi:hypothetical protein GCM10017744_091910 [Streptomyces antimycoticus]|uniref:Tyr recombinase domain-containing protein n=1 Tax=Streptomyces antimycoticus TaxID=68175 RepID=A0A4D4JZS5_9ACTN|nr:hypothetical protein SANT12839_003890 [Streptomyces antimycoticus]